MISKEVRSRSHLAMFLEVPALIFVKEGGIHTHLIMIGMLLLLGAIGGKEDGDGIQTVFLLFQCQGLQEWVVDCLHLEEVLVQVLEDLKNSHQVEKALGATIRMLHQGKGTGYAQSQRKSVQTP
jgi:hypothetical protein